MKTLSLDKINIEGGTQIRVSLDTSHVDELATLKELEPVVVYFDGSAYWLADGFHRYFAAKKRGAKSIAVKVIKGTQREAILHACGANASHGLKRTIADKRSAVLTLLNDKEWGKKSANWIAEKCRVSDTFVLELRKSGSNVGTSVEGKDGKQHPAKKWKDVPETEEEANLDDTFEEDDPKPKFHTGQTVRVISTKKSDKKYFGKEREVLAVERPGPSFLYTLEFDGEELGFEEAVLELVEDEPVGTEIAAGAMPAKDQTGHPITDLAIVSIFNRGRELEDLARKVSDIKSVVTRGVEGKDELFAEINLSQFQADCANLHRALRFATPHAVCRYCKGESRSTKTCKCCRGKGWVTETGFKATPKEMQ